MDITGGDKSRKKLESNYITYGTTESINHEFFSDKTQ